MAKNFSLAVSFLMVCAMARPALADGMVYHHPTGGWQLQKEHSQMAAISYRDGYETLLLYINTARGENEAVWVFPIPAKPDKVAIGQTEGFPRFYGSSLSDKARTAILGAFAVMELSQIYPVVLAIPLLFFGSIPYNGANPMYEEGWPSMGGASDSRVFVHESIERDGVTTQLITATDSLALYGYLANKGFDMPVDSKSIFDDYLGKDYSFVVTWVSKESPPEPPANPVTVPSYRVYDPSYRDYNAYGYRTLAVFATFPTDKIYFPLKPTSIYQSDTVPLKLYILGHVTPQLYPELSMYAKTDYYEGHSADYRYTTDEFIKLAVDAGGWTGQYTKLELNAPSKYMKEDLWFSPYAPIRTSFDAFMSGWVLLWAPIVFALLSAFASIAAGWFAFKDDVSKKTLALFGLANFFTIIGFAIAAAFMQTWKLPAKLRKGLARSGASAWDTRKVVYCLLFSAIFAVSALVAGAALYFLA
jgi:hypothetical protein